MEGVVVGCIDGLGLGDVALLVKGSQFCGYCVLYLAVDARAVTVPRVYPAGVM